MDLLLNTLTEWLKELLAGAIASNLTGMVDSVNTKVGDIAAQVGQTPQGWNSGIFHMIQNLSNNVILPIAGIILALVMTMEFIRIIMDKNNMHDFDTWSILMWVFKTACAILIVSNTWNIVMAVFDVSQTVVNNAAGIIVGNTDIELVTEGLEETLMAMELSSLIGLWFQSMIVGVTMHILSIIIILPDMHEALVSRGDFYQVREILEAGRRENEAKLEASRNYREKHPQIFKSGIVRCGHCGSNLGYSRHGEKKEGRYNCRNKQYGRCDVAVGISEKKLAPIVWNAIQTQFALFADFEEVAGRLKDSGIQTKRQTELQQEMLEVGNQLSGYQNKREQLYNDYVDGILSAGDYMELKTRFDTAYQEQSSRLNQLSVELARLNRMLSDENKWLVNIRNIRKARKLTPEIAQAMIDHINVYKTGYAQHRLEIIFCFQEERDALEAAYHELEGGEAR